MKLFIILFLLLLDTQAWSKEGKEDVHIRHPLYTRIIELSPTLDSEEAMNLSNSISHWSKVYKVDPLRVVAIVKQESNFRNVNRTTTVLIEGKVVVGISDVGVGQVNVASALHYGIDVARLQVDQDYAVEQTCRLLQTKMLDCSYLGEESWSCYHSKSAKERKIYVDQVNRWYKSPLNKRDD